MRNRPSLFSEETENWFKKKLESYESDLDFLLEQLILEVTEEICYLMNLKKINRSQLAVRMKTLPSTVTRILKGKNITLRSLVKIANAMNYKVQIRLVSK